MLRKYPAEIKELNERIAGYEQDSARLAEHPKPAEGIAPMVLNGVIYTERENAGKAIIHACTHMNGVETVPVGSYRGFDMVLSYDSKANEFHMTLKGSLSHTAVLVNPTRERQTGNGDLHPSAFTGRGREQGSRLFRPAALLSPTLQKVAYFRKFSLCGCGRCFKIAGCSDTQPARKPL